MCRAGILYFQTKAWVLMDSNHRSRKTADLQSAPFGHSGKHPFLSPQAHPTASVTARQNLRRTCETSAKVITFSFSGKFSGLFSKKTVFSDSATLRSLCRQHILLSTCPKEALSAPQSHGRTYTGDRPSYRPPKPCWHPRRRSRNPVPWDWPCCRTADRPLPAGRVS